MKHEVENVGIQLENIEIIQKTKIIEILEFISTISKTNTSLVQRQSKKRIKELEERSENTI